MKILAAFVAVALGLLIILDTVYDWKIIPFKRSPAPRWAPLVRVGFGILFIVLGILGLTGNL